MAHNDKRWTHERHIIEGTHGTVIKKSYEGMKRGEWDYMSMENIKAKYEYDDGMK